MPIIKPNESLPPRPVIIVLYGEPGCAKTSIFNTCENPLLLDFDRGVDRSIMRKDTLIMNTWDDVLTEEQKGTYRDYKTIGIDTAKAALDDYLMNYVIKNDYSLKKNKLQMFGVIGDNFKIFVNNRRSEQANIVIIAHAKKDEDTKKIIPDVTGQSYQLLLRIADQVGYVSIKNGKRVIQFEPTDGTVGKNVAGLPDTEVPDKADPSFKTFGQELVNMVKNAIAAMSEEQREAMEKSAKYQEEIAICETPEDLTAVLDVIRELPDWLNLPLRKACAAKAKECKWEFDKEAKVYKAIAPLGENEKLFSLEDVTETPPAKFTKTYNDLTALLTVLKGVKSRHHVAGLYMANHEFIDSNEELRIAFANMKTMYNGQQAAA